MKDSGNANTTKANTTRGNVYTIYKYPLTNPSNTFQINQQQQASGRHKYENVYIQMVAIEFLRRLEIILQTKGVRI